MRGTRSCLIDGTQNVFQHTLNISNYVIVPKPQDEITHGFQDRGSACVTYISLIMLAAIKFKDEFGLRAKEIHDKAIDRDLSLELPTREPAIAQTEPQQSLGICLMPMQSPGEIGFSKHCQGIPLTPTLSPSGERERTELVAPSLRTSFPALGRRPSK